MEHWILRCKHCRKEYTYCTYGNGSQYGTEEGCSKEYCAECQKAIDEALNKIPQKFKPIEVEIEDKEMLDKLLQIKKRALENVTNSFSQVVSFLFSCDFDVIDRYTHDGKVYLIKYNESDDENKHLFVEKEFDILNNKTTDKYWRAKTKVTIYLLATKSHKIS